VGEQAGFQDALAGFGMRFAMRSGLLSAESITHGSDYASLWKRDLLPLVRAGIVNRFLFNVVGEGGRRYALSKLSKGDAGSILRRLYQPSMLSRLLFPFARFRYRAPLLDRSCDHVDCHCVWCQCHREIEVDALT
jgi:flavin-dependent dehydrogenase